MLKSRKPTKADTEHMRRVAELGCIVCRLFNNVETPAEIHHTDGKTKKGAHRKVIGLCVWHHREGSSTDEYVSRHPHKTEFEERYGNEQLLMDITKELLGE